MTQRFKKDPSNAWDLLFSSILFIVYLLVLHRIILICIAFLANMIRAFISSLNLLGFGVSIPCKHCTVASYFPRNNHRFFPIVHIFWIVKIFQFQFLSSQDSRCFPLRIPWRNFCWALKWVILEWIECTILMYPWCLKSRFSGDFGTDQGHIRIVPLICPFDFSTFF